MQPPIQVPQWLAPLIVSVVAFLALFWLKGTAAEEASILVKDHSDRATTRFERLELEAQVHARKIAVLESQIQTMGTTIQEGRADQKAMILTVNRMAAKMDVADD